MPKEVIDQNAISAEVAEMLKKAAEQQAEEEQTSIPFISLRGKKFSVGEDKLGTVMTVVILASIFDNSYYDRAYDPSSEEVFPPACFSIYEDIANAVPHETSPVRQGEDCDSCTMNQFGSAKQGKGKACRNGRRILIASVTEGRVNLSDLAIVNMSPTALKAYSRYVKAVTVTKKLPMWGVITQLSFEEDCAYPVLQVGYVDTVMPADIEFIAQRLEEFQEKVEVAYDVSNYEAPPQVDDKKTAKKSKMS